MQGSVANLFLGNLHIKPWYPSFYPEDLVGGRKAERLYVCQWCFRYTPEIMKYSAHCVSSLFWVIRAKKAVCAAAGLASCWDWKVGEP